MDPAARDGDADVACSREAEGRQRRGDGHLGRARRRALLARGLALPVTRGGTYLVMEGPQFSTKAESELYRQWGCSVIGMTNMPEAKLAREAEMCYATVAMVTDYDCWHKNHDDVTVNQIIQTMNKNTKNVKVLFSFMYFNK